MQRKHRFVPSLCLIFLLAADISLWAEHIFLEVKEDSTPVFKGKDRVATLRKGQKVIQTAEKGNWLGIEWEATTGKVELGWVRASQVARVETYEIAKDAGGIGLNQVPTDSLMGRKDAEEKERLLPGNLAILGDWKAFDRDGSGELNLAELVEFVKAKNFVVEEVPMVMPPGDPNAPPIPMDPNAPPPPPPPPPPR